MPSGVGRICRGGRAAGLMRALLSPPAVPARQRYKRVARAWGRPWLAPGWLTPRLVRAALALVAPDPAPWPTAGLTHLVLDSVRCGRWERVTLGHRASEIRSLLGGADRDRWTAAPALYGAHGAAPAGTLVLGRGLVVL